MKQPLLVLGIIIAISCNQNKKDVAKVGLVTDTTYTSGIIAINVSSNDYRAATLMRIIRDSVKLITTDSSGGKFTQEKKVVRDTSYYAWWPYIVPDSLKRPLKSKLDATKDSIIFRFRAMEKGMVLQDFNRSWK